jgi:hypothetical protein
MGQSGHRIMLGTFQLILAAILFLLPLEAKQWTFDTGPKFNHHR